MADKNTKDNVYKRYYAEVELEVLDKDPVENVMGYQEYNVKFISGKYLKTTDDEDVSEKPFKMLSKKHVIAVNPELYKTFKLTSGTYVIIDTIFKNNKYTWAIAEEYLSLENKQELDMIKKTQILTELNLGELDANKGYHRATGVWGDTITAFKVPQEYVSTVFDGQSLSLISADGGISWDFDTEACATESNTSLAAEMPDFNKQETKPLNNNNSNNMNTQTWTIASVTPANPFSTANGTFYPFDVVNTAGQSGQINRKSQDSKLTVGQAYNFVVTEGPYGLKLKQEYNPNGAAPQAAYVPPTQPNVPVTQGNGAMYGAATFTPPPVAHPVHAPAVAPFNGKASTYLAGNISAIVTACINTGMTDQNQISSMLEYWATKTMEYTNRMG